MADKPFRTLDDRPAIKAIVDAKADATETETALAAKQATLTSTSDVPGLDAALTSKASIVGATRIVVSETEPLDPQEGDLWLQVAGATPPDTTGPTIAGTLTALALSGAVQLSGPTATDDAGISKWQYQIDGGEWVDIASTSTTMPTTTVSGLTNGQAYSFAVRALDPSSNASATRTASATPMRVFVVDFSAGGALTADLTKNEEGGGTVTIAGNKATILTTADGQRAELVFSNGITKTEVATYELDIKIISASQYVSGLGLFTLGDAASPTRTALQITASQVTLMRKIPAGTYEFYNWSNDTWQAGSIALPRDFTAARHKFKVETRPNAGTPQFRYLVTDVAGNVVDSTVWTNFNTLKDDGTYAYSLQKIGDGVALAGYNVSAEVYRVVGPAA